MHKSKRKNEEKNLSLAELKQKFSDWMKEDIDMSDELDDAVIYEVKFVEKVNKAKTINEFLKLTKRRYLEDYTKDEILKGKW